VHDGEGPNQQLPSAASVERSWEYHASRVTLEAQDRPPGRLVLRLYCLPTTRMNPWTEGPGDDTDSVVVRSERSNTA